MGRAQHTTGDGDSLSQPDFLDPYHIRNDLYVQRGGVEMRLTRGARLSAPDPRTDGEIVAVQDVPATTRLVRVSRDGRSIVPLTQTNLDVQWSDPRWSPDGSRIAAVMQSRGRSQIAVLDADGKLIDAFGGSHSVNSGPSWSSDGRRIYFSSERSGSPQIYVADVSSFSPSLARVTDAATGVFSPEVSPDRTKLASLLFSADGYHIGVAPLIEPLKLFPADSSVTSPRVGCSNCLNLVQGLPPLGAADSSVARPYSPWRSLLPRYWQPVIESTTDDGTSFGAFTSGTDIVGRHDYSIQALRNNRFHENSAWLWYRYAGLGLPLLDFYATQNFSHDVVVSDDGTGFFTPVGNVSERSRIASLQATFIRPRFRDYTVASFGAEVENIRYSTDPDTLLPQLSPFYRAAHTYPALIASAGWSNARRPALSISSEDGISASISGRQRWHRGSSGPTRSVSDNLSVQS